MYIGLQVKYSLKISQIKGKAHFLGSFSKSIHISDFMKVRPLSADLFHVGSRTNGRTWQSW